MLQFWQGNEVVHFILLTPYCICLLLCCFVITGAQFLLASKLYDRFTSSFMELITCYATKCLQFANHLWTWSCANLLLVLMLCLRFKFDGHTMKCFWRLLQASTTGVVFLLFRAQLIAHKSIFRNLKKLMLQKKIVQFQSL